MKGKIILFLAVFYTMTVVAAFLMAEDDPFIESKPEETPAVTKPIAPSSQEPQVTPETPTEPESPPVRAEETAASVEENKVKLERPYAGQSPQHWAFTFMGGLYRPLEFHGQGDKFENIYAGDDPLFDFIGNKGVWADLSLEWQFLKNVGKLGTKLTTGSWAITRQFDSPSDQDTVKNSYILWVVPAFLGGVYRMQYWTQQPLVPFIEGGAGGFRFQQINGEAANGYKNIYRKAYMAGAGIELNTILIDPKASKNFDVDWGVNNTFLTAEYRIIQSIDKDDFDFSGRELITAGFVFEF